MANRNGKLSLIQSLASNRNVVVNETPLLGAMTSWPPRGGVLVVIVISAEALPPQDNVMAKVSPAASVFGAMDRYCFMGANGGTIVPDVADGTRYETSLVDHDT